MADYPKLKKILPQSGDDSEDNSVDPSVLVAPNGARIKPEDQAIEPSIDPMDIIPTDAVGLAAAGKFAALAKMMGGGAGLVKAGAALPAAAMALMKPAATEVAEKAVGAGAKAAVAKGAQVAALKDILGEGAAPAARGVYESALESAAQRNVGKTAEDLAFQAQGIKNLKADSAAQAVKDEALRAQQAKLREMALQERLQAQIAARKKIRQ